MELFARLVLTLAGICGWIAVLAGLAASLHFAYAEGTKESKTMVRVFFIGSVMLLLSFCSVWAHFPVN